VPRELTTACPSRQLSPPDSSPNMTCIFPSSTLELYIVYLHYNTSTRLTIDAFTLTLVSSWCSQKLLKPRMLRHFLKTKCCTIMFRNHRKTPQNLSNPLPTPKYHSSNNRRLEAQTVLVNSFKDSKYNLQNLHLIVVTDLHRGPLFCIFTYHG